MAAVTATTAVSNIESDAESKTIVLKPSLERSVETASLEKGSTATRKIASADDDDHSQIVDQSFFCNHSIAEKSLRAKSVANLVMINFKLCKDEKKIEAINLINESNGFVAQLFKTGPVHYKTDYIQLNNGSNKIVVEVVLKDGQKSTDSLVILTGS